MCKSIKTHTPEEIGKKLNKFKSFDSVHEIKRDRDGNVIGAENLIGEPCHYIDNIIGRRHMVAPIDHSKCAIVSRGNFTGIYDLALFDLLYNIRISGRTDKGYHEVLITRDAIVGLTGIIPNVEVLYMPLFVRSDFRRRTAMHKDVYALLTGDLDMAREWVIHHNLEGKLFRTYNVLDNLCKESNSEHTKRHMLKYYEKMRRENSSKPE